MYTRMKLKEKSVTEFIRRTKGSHGLAGQLPQLEKLMPPHIRSSFIVQNEEVYGGNLYWEWSCVISCRCAVCFAVSLSAEDAHCRFQKVVFDDGRGGASRNWHYEEDIATELRPDDLLAEQLERAFSDGIRVLQENYLMDLDVLAH